MGTSDFAAPTLETLASLRQHEIIAAYTKPPRSRSKKYKNTLSRIHEMALDYNIEVYTPENFKNDPDIKSLEEMNPDLIVVVDYGIILPKTILNIPKYGCINLHPSLLPRWRGAAPVQRSIMAGDRETGICIIQMDERMDTGDILAQQNIDVDDNITHSALSRLLSEKGALMFPQLIADIELSNVIPKKQSAEGVTIAAKISHLDEIIDWNNDAKTIHSQIRALSPKPGAYFEYANERIKIITAHYSLEKHSYKPGTVLDDNLTIACAHGIIKPTLLQRQGRKVNIYRCIPERL